MNKIVSSLAMMLLVTYVTAQNSEKYIQDMLQHRDKYRMSFLQDKSSPLEAKDIEDLDFFGIKPELCLSCTYELIDAKEETIMATYSGKQKSYIKYAKFTCPLYDSKIYFYGYKDLRSMNMPNYKDLIFIPFKDKTNGDSTYGGGRYMDVDMVKDNVNGKITIDLNKAYNPWCCYSDGYNCPIPPVENNQKITIRAGEKMFKGDTKH